MRLTSSARVYQELIRKIAPGKNGASTKPRKNLMATSAPNECAAAF